MLLYSNNFVDERKTNEGMETAFQCTHLSICFTIV